MAPTPIPPPPLNIPPSPSTVLVSIIDSTAQIQISNTFFLSPIMPGMETFNAGSYAFLIEHPPSGKKILYDLGIRKDWWNLAPFYSDMVKKGAAKVSAEKNVSEILVERGVQLEDIDAIIWSHYHLDHSGDPSEFPPSTDLVVGPGFKDALLPGYPANPDAPILETDYEGRNLREIPFDDAGLWIGKFRAMDYFGDGSFYLLDTPGHAIGHLAALARTTSDPDPSFVFLGGDCAHHPALIRPTPYHPLPTTLTPSPLPTIHPGACPGSVFAAIHRSHHPGTDAEYTTPFFRIPAEGGMAHDARQCQESVDGMAEFDADESVLVLLAHDESLRGVVRFWGEGEGLVNSWREDGWGGGEVRWRFLRDFETAVRGGGNDDHRKVWDKEIELL